VAISFAASPLVAIELLDGIERSGALHHYAPFHLARADVFRRLRRGDEMRQAYRDASACASNERVRAFIEQRLRTSS
jgi:predicted RNA polymerase sigma factor